MTKSLVTHGLALMAYTGINIARCQADPIALCTNPPPLLPHDNQLSTNALFALSTTNLPPLALEASPPKPGDIIQIFPPATSTVPAPSLTHTPGIYLASPYAMQVKVPDNVDPAMAHSPTANLSFKTPSITPDQQFKRQ